MTDHVELRPGLYRDSVTLMQVSRTVAAVEGVQAALVAMATELNLDLLVGMGFDLPAGPGGRVSPNDLLVAVRGDEEIVPRALAAVDEALSAKSRGGAGTSGGVGGLGGGARAPRTVGAAVADGAADLALVSVPGRYAFAEALDALEAGLSVMVFSDNVPVEQEIRLKDEAARRGRLVMGPDCGTAHVGGVGLGFANAVRPGPVGLVAASGTGAQQFMCLLDAADVGLSACLGVGGRDLRAEVGGRSTLQALEALDADPSTELVVVVSKPPAPEVAERVRAAAAAARTPVLLALLGPGQEDLTAVAERAVRAVGQQPPEWPRWTPGDGSPDRARHRAGRPGGRFLRGLFSGGTLCDEAMVVAAAALGPIASNIPLEPEWALPAGLRAESHLMIDFGDDELTSGRPHPMIDSGLRTQRLTEDLADPATAVVLLDVVLGHGAHPDPAADLAPLVAGAPVPVVVSLSGTRDDPQGLTRQAETFAAAGAEVFLSNAAAARRAVALVPGHGEDA